MRHFARLHGEIGLRIDRLALGQQLRASVAAGSAVLQHRPVVLALVDPPHQHVEFGGEPDRDALRLDGSARIGVHDGAAAGRQHLRAALEQPRDHARLAAAEIGLAMAGENVRDAHAGGFLDLGIGVDERHAKPGAEPAADRGFADPHHADQHDRAAAQTRPGSRLPKRRRLRHFVMQYQSFTYIPTPSGRPAASSADITSARLNAARDHLPVRAEHDRTRSRSPAPMG